MKHPNPSTIDPKEDATSSTLTLNSADRSTKPGLTMGPSAPSRDEANALDNKFIGQGSFCRQNNVQCPETCFLFPTRPVQSMLIMI